MLSSKGRSFAQAAFGPIAKAFVKAGISADVVTITGTVAAVVLALWMFPNDHLASGALAIGALALFDSLDGQIARLTGTSSKWGAFLDSTLDRVTDAAIFVGLYLWAHTHAGQDTRGLLAVGLLGALVTGSIVPYARARAEGLGMTASVGIAERADRLVIILVAALLVGLDLSEFILVGASWYLFIAGIVTVIQRMVVVHRQAHEDQHRDGRAREEGDRP